MSGMWWMMPTVNHEVAHLFEAIEYFVEVHGRAPAAVDVPPVEKYAAVYGQIKPRARAYVPARHIFMWLDEPKE